VRTAEVVFALVTIVVSACASARSADEPNDGGVDTALDAGAAMDDCHSTDPSDPCPCLLRQETSREPCTVYDDVFVTRSAVLADEPAFMGDCGQDLGWIIVSGPNGLLCHRAVGCPELLEEASFETKEECAVSCGERGNRESGNAFGATVDRNDDAFLYVIHLDFFEGEFQPWGREIGFDMGDVWPAFDGCLPDMVRDGNGLTVEHRRRGRLTVDPITLLGFDGPAPRCYLQSRERWTAEMCSALGGASLVTGAHWRSVNRVRFPDDFITD